MKKSYKGCWIARLTACRVPPKIDRSIFPECVARVPVSLWGFGGWGCVRSTLHLRSQPFATVRNCSQPFARSPYGRAFGKFCRRGHFWRFQTSRCFVSLGWRGTSWHSDVFCNVSKVVLCGRRKTFATFSQDALQFSWQAQHFGRVHRHFVWQAQHFRCVVLRVFCKSHWQGCVKWRQGANSVAGVAFLRWAENWRNPARNIDFEVAEFQVPEKSRRKTSIFKLQSVKIGGSLARNARFGAPTCLVSSLWFSCGLAVSMGEARKSRTKCSFWCSHLSRLESLVFWWLRRRGTLWHSNLFYTVSKVVLCGRRNTFASFSQDDLHFSWQAQHFADLCRHFAWQAQHFRRVALRALHWLYTPHSTLRTSHSTPSTSYIPHFTLYTPDSTLYTLHFTLYTLRSTLYTPHSTLYTLHSTLSLHTPHFTLYTLHFRFHSPHFKLHTLHFTLHTPHSTLYTRHSPLHTLHLTLHTLHSSLHTLHCCFSSFLSLSRILLIFSDTDAVVLGLNLTARARLRLFMAVGQHQGLTISLLDPDAEGQRL